MHELPELLPAYQMVFHELHETVVAFVAARTGEPPSALYPQVLAGVATVAAKASLYELDGPQASPATLREMRHRAYDALTVGLDRLAAQPSVVSSASTVLDSTPPSGRT